MSRENVELVREAFESFATLGLVGMAERYWAEQVEYVEDPAFPGASTCSVCPYGQPRLRERRPS
jgi:hypothetical protein